MKTLKTLALLTALVTCHVAAASAQVVGSGQLRGQLSFAVKKCGIDRGRAEVGIAMGKGGTAIASEAADVIVLTDDLSRLADVVLLGRRTMSVIRWDVAIWAVSNMVGFGLVLTGVLGPAMAAFYNFATDFFPLMNSGRLFRSDAILKE